MKLETDTLQSLKRLEEAGFDRTQSETLVALLCETEIRNLLDENEVRIMVADAIQKVFDKADRDYEARERNYEKRLEESRRQADQRHAEVEKRLDREFAKTERERRWLMGIGVGILISVVTLIIKLH